MHPHQSSPSQLSSTPTLPPVSVPPLVPDSSVTFRVSTLNVRSIRPCVHHNGAVSFQRADAVMAQLAAARSDVTFLQETSLTPGEDYQALDPPLIPPAYAALHSHRLDPDNCDQFRGRGLSILVHPRLLLALAGPSRPSLHLVLLDHVTTSHFEILAAQIGPIFLASVYVKHAPGGPSHDHLAACLHQLRPPSCHHCIVGGDFNFPSQWETCAGFLQDYLDITCHVQSSSISSTHNRGNVLDHLLTTPTLSAHGIWALSIPETDHYLVTLQLSIPSLPSPSHLTPPCPPPRISSSKLRRFHRLSCLPKECVPPHIQALNDRYDDTVAELLTDPITDLADLNARLYEATAAVFGTDTRPPRIERSYMYDRRVRRAMVHRRKAWRHLDKLTRRYAQGAVLAAATSRYREAAHAYEAARRSAQRQAHGDLVLQVSRGNISMFWALFRQRRGAKVAPTPNTRLDPAQTALYFQTLYASPTSAAAVCATLPPSSPSDYVTVSADDVKVALRTLRDTATGPDGVPPLVFKHLAGTLVNPMTDLITQCVNEGIPAPLRQGSITLLAKTSPPSTDPRLYRPITLLPAAIRVLLRVVDLQVRSHLTADTAAPFPIEQGGFLPHRCTHLQTFLLLLQRDHAHHLRQSLYVAFLDVEKAFDTIDHIQLLDILRSLPIPPELVDVVHRLLPEFMLSVFGVAFPQEQGTFQGGPLSPLLCILFLVDLILYLKGDSASAFHGTTFPWKTELVQQIIRLLLFADDIALLATDLEQLALALHLVAWWSVRRRLNFAAHKCKVMRLTRAPSDRRMTADLPAMWLHVTRLEWVSAYPYLGHLIMEARQPTQRLTAQSRVVPIDGAKARSLCRAMTRTFYNTDRSPPITQHPVRMGIKQVVHAKFLYATPLIDVDYDSLDVNILRSVRLLFGYPRTSPSALVFSDLGIWPSRYYGYQRALQLLWRLRHVYWTKDVFEHEWALDDDIPAVADPTWAKHGVMHRFSSILAEAGLSWKALHLSAKEDWDKLVTTHLAEAAYHRHQASLVKHALPYPYGPLGDTAVMTLHGDLLCAVLRFRCPRLRDLPGSDLSYHGCCRFCRDGAENGAHLLFCSSLPARLLARRSALVAALVTDLTLRYHPFDPTTPDGRDALIKYFMTFQWTRDHQQLGTGLSGPCLIKALAVFCRDLIKAYAAFQPEWEPSDLRSFPVLKPRPIAPPLAPPAHQAQAIDLQDLLPFAPTEFDL